MTERNAIIHACAISGDGKSRFLEGNEISTLIRADELAWVHLDVSHSESRKWLNREITYLDHIIVDALLANETRPRILEFENGCLMILRGVNLNENALPEDMISIRLWVDQHRIISIQTRPLQIVWDLIERFKEGRGPKNAGDFVAMLTSGLFKRMEPEFIQMDEHLDAIEEMVMMEPDKKERQKITTLRKRAIMFRRYIAPQRDVLSYLRTSEFSWLDIIHKRKIQESLDRVIRYMEDLDAIRERAQIVKDELANGLADRMNKNMYVLSIVAAIFLPLGFFTGLLGINIGGIPGADNDLAFYIFCGILTILVILQIIIFKKFKWF